MWYKYCVENNGFTPDIDFDAIESNPYEENIFPTNEKYSTQDIVQHIAIYVKNVLDRIISSYQPPKYTFSKYNFSDVEIFDEVKESARKSAKDAAMFLKETGYDIPDDINSKIDEAILDCAPIDHRSSFNSNFMPIGNNLKSLPIFWKFFRYFLEQKLTNGNNVFEYPELINDFDVNNFKDSI